MFFRYTSKFTDKMKASIFAVCICKLDELFQSNWNDDLPSPDSFLKLLEYATMIEAEDDDELPPIVMRGFNSMSKEAARCIVDIRNSSIFSSLSLSEERFVYRTLRKIYNQK